MAPPAHSRSTRTVMLLEDEMMPALVAEGILSDAGFDVVGPVPTVEEALALLRNTRVDAALLDLHMNGVFSHEVGARCDELGIPWGIITGHEAQSKALAGREVPVLLKPFVANHLIAMVESLLRCNPRQYPPIPSRMLGF